MGIDGLYLLVVGSVHARQRECHVTGFLHDSATAAGRRSLLIFLIIKLLQMKKLLLLWMAATLALVPAGAQTLTGTVRQAESGEPMEGVTVIVTGTTAGALTDADGSYRLALPADARELVFSFIGYKKIAVAIDGRSRIDVELEADVLQLEEVVVTALGISREKKSLGYAVQDVTGDELSGSGEVNVIQALSAKAAGIQVVGSGGTPGASSKVLIRGASTFTNENQPLIVVDGVPIDNETVQTAGRDYPFNENLTGVNNSNRAIDINPDDIASVTVLKGPAAAALYGVRAGNGAIIITTKRGGKGRVVATFRTSLEISQVNKLPDLQDTYAQGDLRSGVPTYLPADPGPDNVHGTADDVSGGSSSSWGPKIADLPGVGTYDNMGTFFRTAYSTNNNLSLSGGTDQTSFRLSVGYLLQNGIVPNSDFGRVSVRLTSDTRLSSQVKVGGTVNYINSGGTRVQNGSNLSGVMLTLTRTPPSFNLRGEGEQGWLYPNSAQRQYFAIYDNPYFTAYENPFTDQVDRVLGNAYATWQPLKWLQATWRVGGDIYSDQRQQIYAIGSWEPDNAPLGELRENTLRYREVYSDLLVSATYEQDDLRAGITLGNNFNHRYRQDLFARGRNLAVPGFYNFSNTNDLYTSEFEETVRTAALFFDAQASWRDLLFLNLTGRNEWASTFGESKNNFFYPSANLAFAFSELMPENAVFSFGKVRLAYAQSGINPDPYNTRNLFVQPFFTDGFTNGLSFPYLGLTGFGYSASLGNAELRPEKVTGLEAGFDLRFFLGRLNLDLTLYQQTSTDLLVLRPLAGSTGYRFVYGNFGSMVNRGIEAIVSGDPVKTDAFQWNITVNFTRNVNEVLETAEGVDEINIETAFGSIGSFAIVGQPYGALYASLWQRNEQGELIINPNTGLPLIEPQDGNVGNPFPDWLAGVRNTFTFKGLSLTALLDIRQGGDIWCGTCARLDRLGMTERSADRERTYIIPGVIANPDGSFRPNDIEISAYTYYQRFVGDNGAAEEEAVYDGSWVRLRELGLSYTLPLDKKGFLKQADIALSGRNLWLLTDYPGVDPETSLTGAGSNVSGFDYFNNPGTRSFIATLGLGF
ncbi:MAG: SusC/RagA family TonB-linked outer membrane protein [Bacteroidia bacterium]